MTIARGPYQILTILDKHRQSSPNAVTAQPKRRLEGLRRTTRPTKHPRDAPSPSRPTQTARQSPLPGRPQAPRSSSRRTPF